MLRPNIGYLGYFAGPAVHVLDPYGLADPLLARLPISTSHVDPITGTRWRIRHFARDIPRGYPESLREGRNEIVDPDLARYHDKLSIATRGDLGSLRRLAEIWKLNTGSYDHFLEAYLAARPD